MFCRSLSLLVALATLWESAAAAASSSCSCGPGSTVGSWKCGDKIYYCSNVNDIPLTDGCGTQPAKNSEFIPLTEAQCATMQTVELGEDCVSAEGEKVSALSNFVCYNTLADGTLSAGTKVDTSSCDVCKTTVPFPTTSPTGAPDVTPEIASTPSPTASPTNKPTENPTDKPTNEPTASPTGKPTDKPTNEPTEAPTDKPTDGPKPTDKPTELPKATTASPTETPVTENQEEVTQPPTTAATATTPPELPPPDTAAPTATPVTETQPPTTGATAITPPELPPPDTAAPTATPVTPVTETQPPTTAVTATTPPELPPPDTAAPTDMPVTETQPPTTGATATTPPELPPPFPPAVCDMESFLSQYNNGATACPSSTTSIVQLLEGGGSSNTDLLYDFSLTADASTVTFSVYNPFSETANIYVEVETASEGGFVTPHCQSVQGLVGCDGDRTDNSFTVACRNDDFALVKVYMASSAEELVGGDAAIPKCCHPDPLDSAVGVVEMVYKIDCSCPSATAARRLRGTR
jgi:hypothetical protein